MKLNSKDFFVEDEVLDAKENEIVYSHPKSGIEDLWDKLAKEYINLTKDSDEKAVKLRDFHYSISKAKVENEISLTTLDLIKKGILNTEKIQRKTSSTTNITKYLLCEILAVLKKGQSILKKNIKEEIEVYNDLKHSSLPVKLIDNRIFVDLGDSKIIQYNKGSQLSHIKPKGLTCFLYYKGITIIGSVCGLSRNKYKLAKECQIEKLVVGVFEKFLLKIKITNEYTDKRNKLCDSILIDLLNGNRLEDMYHKIIIGLSRYFLKLLLQPYKVIKAVNLENESFEVDGYTKRFYVLADTDIYEVNRTDIMFDIYLNGKLLVLKNMIPAYKVC